MKIIVWKKGIRGRISLSFLFFSLSFAYFYISNLFAQQIVLKCATIAPENSPWAELAKKASTELQEKTGGLVKMEWYFSSIAGDEPDIAKKLKEGKLDCAGLTGNGISYLVPPIRILELPFFLKNVKEVDFIKQRSMKLFQNIANDYNVKLIWISDLGFVYIFSKQPLKKLDDIKGKTVWVWKGDYLAEFIGKFLQSEFQIKSFSIPIQDVKSQLDQIQILYNTPYALNVFGWDSGVKYILSQPLNFSFTSLIVSKNSMDKIPPDYQNIVEEVLRKYLDILTKMNRESDNKAIDILKKKGVEMTDFSQDEVKKAEDIFREKVWLALKDKLYPSWLLAQLLTELSAFRVGGSK